MMFRKMRRHKQELERDESIRILSSATAGVLAVSGDNDYPYAVPLNHVYWDNKIFFHCARDGHKIDAIKNNPKVSYCVIDKDDVVSKEFTTYFRSVIAFGRARLVEDPEEKRNALMILADKFAPDREAGWQPENDKFWPGVCIIEIEIEHITGKEAIELMNSRKK